MESEEKKEEKRGGLINEFFWICSGADRKILRQCPTDYAKYFGIGGTILFTALMAMLSGGYAFSTIFDAGWAAVLFGIFWGLLIFNLDRFMVNTMYSDGKHTISREELMGGLPRIILAIFIGIVISAPIELRIFEDKIEPQLARNDARMIQKVNSECESLKKQITENDSIINLLEGKLNGVYINPELDKLIEKQKKRVDDLRIEMDEQLYGRNGKKPGKGPSYQAVKEQYDAACEELTRLIKRREDKAISAHLTDDQKEQIRQQIHDYMLSDSTLQASIDQIRGKSVHKDKTGKIKHGLCDRLSALSMIASLRDTKEIVIDENGKKKEVVVCEANATLFFTRILVMFLFIIVEVIPTLFKMMISAGPYDMLVDEEKERKKAASTLRISQINDNVNTELKISTQNNINKIEAETEANKILLTRIATAQAEMLETAIELWKEEEMEKIKANPSAYIKSNTSASAPSASATTPATEPANSQDPETPTNTQQ